MSNHSDSPNLKKRQYFKSEMSNKYFDLFFVTAIMNQNGNGRVSWVSSLLSEKKMFLGKVQVF